MKKLFIFLAILFYSQAAYAKLVTQTVDYRDGATVLEGYLAYDDSVAGKRPAVIVVHEWKGLGDYTKMRAEKLAGLGYVAFAADIYGKGVRPEDHAEAGKIAGMYKGDRNLTRGRVAAALAYVKNLEQVDPQKIAAMGYCFGGMAVLEMARAGMDVKGVITFHGALDTPVPAKEGEIKAKILSFQGALDPFVTPENVSAFEQEMTQAKADWQLVKFSGAVHSFTVPEAGNDPSKGVAYNEAADRRSWAMTEQFLKEIF